MVQSIMTLLSNILVIAATKVGVVHSYLVYSVYSVYTVYTVHYRLVVSIEILWLRWKTFPYIHCIYLCTDLTCDVINGDNIAVQLEFSHKNFSS